MNYDEQRGIYIQLESFKGTGWTHKFRCGETGHTGRACMGTRTFMLDAPKDCPPEVRVAFSTLHIVKRDATEMEMRICIAKRLDEMMVDWELGKLGKGDWVPAEHSMMESS